MIPITFYIYCQQSRKFESHRKQWKVFAAKNYLIFWLTREQSASSDGQAGPILDIGDENTQPFMVGQFSLCKISDFPQVRPGHRPE